MKLTMDGLIIDVQWFRVLKHEKPWHIIRHVHSFYEIHLIQCGSCRVVTDEGEFIVKENEFYITAPGVYHEQFSQGAGEFIEFCLCVDLFLSSVNADNSEAKIIFELLKNVVCKNIYDQHGAIALFRTALNEAFEREIESEVIIYTGKLADEIKTNTHMKFI